jgi:hypothetical protein
MQIFVKNVANKKIVADYFLLQREILKAYKHLRLAFLEERFQAVVFRFRTGNMAAGSFFHRIVVVERVAIGIVARGKHRIPHFAGELVEDDIAVGQLSARTAKPVRCKASSATARY